jgi:hypothetical protein
VVETDFEVIVYREEDQWEIDRRPAGDMSIFADLGLDEMELGA